MIIPELNYSFILWQLRKVVGKFRNRSIRKQSVLEFKFSEPTDMFIIPS